jgi:hypothetical protein
LETWKTYLGRDSVSIDQGVIETFHIDAPSSQLLRYLIFIRATWMKDDAAVAPLVPKRLNLPATQDRMMLAAGLSNIENSLARFL